MTDELVKRLLNAPADGLGTENLCLEAADRIEALTTQIDRYRVANMQLLVDINKAFERIEKLTADNERMENLLTGIKRAAAHRMKNDQRDLHSYYFHAACAALKGESHE